MNYRINTKVIILVILLLLIAGALFVYILISAPTTVQNNVVKDEINVTTQLKERTLIAKHQFLDGVHTIVGKAEVPTSCHRLVAEPFYVENEQSAVEVRFNTLLEGEECPSQLFEVPFRVSFEALEDAVITAIWDGGHVRLNLVPVQPGETLEDELYIKG